MAFRRKFKRRRFRRSFGRKRSYGGRLVRKFRRGRKYRSGKTKYTRNEFVKRRFLHTGATDTSGGINLALIFKVSDMPGTTDFTTTWDQYRFRYVKLEIITEGGVRKSFDTKTMMNDTVSGEQHEKRGTWVRDYDSSITNTEDGHFQYVDKHKVWNVYNGTKIGIKPASLTQGFSSGGDIYMPKWRQWIDLGNTGTSHYGVGIYHPGTFPQANLGIGGGIYAQYEIYATYYLELRHRR